MPYKFNVFTGTLDFYENAGSSGGVTGIPPTNVGAIARWVDTNATTIQNSPKTNVQDGGAIEAQGFITERTVTGMVTVNSGESWISPSLIIAPCGIIVLNPDAELIMI
jgi:hypothetical protein